MGNKASEIEKPPCLGGLSIAMYLGRFKAIFIIGAWHALVKPFTTFSQVYFELIRLSGVASLRWASLLFLTSSGAGCAARPTGGILFWGISGHFITCWVGQLATAAPARRSVGVRSG